MQRPTTIILMALGLAAIVAVDRLKTIRSGWCGNFTRRGQPARFQRYLDRRRR